MSWSKSAKGTPQEVNAATSKWADEQAETDKFMTPEAIAGHQKQVRAAVAAIGAVFTTVASDVRVEASAWGHHSGEARSDSGGLSVNYSVPVPAA